MDISNLHKRVFLNILLFIIGLGSNAQKPELFKIVLPEEIRTINTLLSCNGSELWLGTGQGLYKYKDGVFTRFYDNNSVYYQINCMVRTEDNEFWWGTYNGVLVKFRNGKISEVYDLKLKCENDNYLITSIAVSPNKPYKEEVLVTTSGGEIISVNKSTKEIMKLKGPDVNTIYVIRYGISPMIWLCTSDGFYTRNKKSKWKRKPGLYTAYHLVENEGKYWAIGRDEQKKSVFMLYYSEKENAPPGRYKWKNFDLRQLNDRFIRFYEVAFTENEIAWIATKEGLVRYNPMTASVRLYSELDGVKLGEINHIAIRKDNSFWISSSGKRLFKVKLK